jgi:hypothetical protein
MGDVDQPAAPAAGAPGHRPELTAGGAASVYFMAIRRGSGRRPQRAELGAAPGRVKSWWRCSVAGGESRNPRWSGRSRVVLADLAE